MPAIPETIIDQVRDRTDIVEVVARFLPLKRAGRNYKAPCPFHHEKTPSFIVSPAKQIFHCFGCGAGGNVFNFLMKYERLEFPEAVRALAERAGINIPMPSEVSSEAASFTQRLHSVNELAAAFYQDNLTRHEQGQSPMQYLGQRGIKNDIIEKFKLGYAPRLWDGLVNFARKKGWSESVLEKAGLVLKKPDGSFYDRFRHRIIFPIVDIKNKVKGFGGRVMDEGAPKYMNSPETQVYNKGSHLYGLNLAWEDIRNQNKAVIVEGYIDLLTPFQHGIRNIVASLGTALTADQVRLLKRFTNNIIVLFDSDHAGEQATVRSLDIIIQEEMGVRVVQLPSGFDPDNFIHKYGKDRLQDMIEKAQDLFDYKLNVLTPKFDPKTPEGKARIAEEMLPTISKMKNAILRAGYLKRLAESLAVDEEALRIELKKVRPDYSYRYGLEEKVRPSHAKTAVRPAEKILAGLMIWDSSLIHFVKERLSAVDFRDNSIRKVVDSLFKMHSEQRPVSPAKLISDLEDEEMGGYISELVTEVDELVDKEKSLADCIKWIKQSNLKEELEAIRSRIKIAQDCGDHDKIVELATLYNNMIKSSEN